MAACCLLAGAAVTIAMAAACLLYAPTTLREDRGGIVSGEVNSRKPGSVGFKHGQRYAGFGYQEWMNYWSWVPDLNAPQGIGAITGAGVTSCSAGWPWLAFESPRDRFPEMCDVTVWNAGVKAANAHATTSDAMPTFLRVRPYRKWPVRPLAGGLVANTVLYGVLIGAVLIAGRAVRSAYRCGRGRCGECGYVLDGLVRCPECGHVVRPPAATVQSAAYHAFRCDSPVAVNFAFSSEPSP